MPINFPDFPAEIRNMIYKHALVLPNPIKLRTMKSPGPTNLNCGTEMTYESSSSSTAHHSDNGRPLSPNLLLANKTVYNEAIRFLYSDNKFLFFHGELETYQQEWSFMASFLLRIGRRNASYLHSLFICFPAFRNQGFIDEEVHYREYTVLRSYSARCLDLIRSRCTNIREIEMGLSAPWNSVYRLEGNIENSVVEADDAMGLTWARLQKIPSLKRVIVSTHFKLSDELMARIEYCGWTFRSDEPENVDETDGAAKVRFTFMLHVD